MRSFRGRFALGGKLHCVTFEATNEEEAVDIAKRWGIGMEGEICDDQPEIAVNGVAPEPVAYDLKTASKLLGNVCRRTIWNWIVLRRLDRVPGCRKTLITRESIERMTKESAHLLRTERRHW
jgi:hypothetical protein